MHTILGSTFQEK